MSLSDIDQDNHMLQQNKFIGVMFKARDANDNNKSLPEYPTWDPFSANLIVDCINQDETQDFSDVTFAYDDSFIDTDSLSCYLVWFRFT